MVQVDKNNFQTVCRRKGVLNTKARKQAKHSFKDKEVAEIFCSSLLSSILIRSGKTMTKTFIIHHSP